MTKTQHSMYVCMCNIGKGNLLLYDIGELTSCFIVAGAMAITVIYFL